MALCVRAVNNRNNGFVIGRTLLETTNKENRVLNER